MNDFNRSSFGLCGRSLGLLIPNPLGDAGGRVLRTDVDGRLGFVCVKLSLREGVDNIGLTVLSTADDGRGRWRGLCRVV